VASSHETSGFRLAPAWLAECQLLIAKRWSSFPGHPDCANVIIMGFGSPKKKVYTEEELYEYAVGALARRMRTVAELKRLLRQKVKAETEFGKTLVELIIRKLKDQGYLNDAKYAAAYSSFRRDNEKFGRLRVVTDLKVKGVHGDVIDQAVSAAFDEVNEEKQARAYLQRKRLAKPTDQKQSARIFRQLVRAGFRSKTIFTILKKWDVDDETLTALESENPD
jgi:regulatory protein